MLTKEINTTKAYCPAIRFLHWPLSSVYYQMRRDGVARFTLSTFYKYVCRLHLKRSRPRHPRKNHHIGIRATAPYQILHADTTAFKTLDNTKNYIYLIQDNFSRAILGFRVEQECKAIHAFQNLQTVIREHLISAGVPSCELITDDGSENAGPVKELMKHTEYPAITHLIAQRDIEFSNFMIEAANKQLKYGFLYHQHIANYEALVKYILQAIEDFNNRPHTALLGLTPIEAKNGKSVDKALLKQQTQAGEIERIAENKKTKCCHYSF
ncbi:MAG: hypothetical protein P4L51_00685 [Puia sp.]|nr:hypothetical protein [Puia sp.]